MDELTFEKIEGYLQGTLPPAERERFEADMNEDETLREAVAFQQQLVASIETESLRQLLEDIHQDHVEEQTPVVAMQARWTFPYRAIAASVALLVLAGGWYIYHQASAPASLYASYFTPVTGLPTTLRYSQDTRFAEGMVAYKLEEYAEAKEWWQPLRQANPTNDTLTFYLGVASLADEQTEAAIDYLSEVTEKSSSVYTTDAQWYLALAYVLDGDQEQARAILTELSQQEGEYGEPSRALLEEL